MPRYRAILLDIDGTLIDSNDAHAASWIDAFREFGLQADFGEVRRLIGQGGDKLMPEVTGIEEESDLGQAISRRRSQIFRERYLPKLEPFPGARPLLERMQAEGFRLVVATSAKEEELGGLLRQAGVEDLLTEQTSSDDADESKPDPDIVQAALKRCECAPAEAVMLGDTPYDAEACRRAGVAFVGVRCGGWGEEDLQPALAVYDGAQDLLDRFEESPLKVS